MSKVYYIDISNLLDRWFSFKDYDQFMGFLSKKIKSGSHPKDIVSEWNLKFARMPKQYVFYKE